MFPITLSLFVSIAMLTAYLKGYHDGMNNNFDPPLLVT